MSCANAWLRSLSLIFVFGSRNKALSAALLNGVRPEYDTFHVIFMYSSSEAITFICVIRMGAIVITFEGTLTRFSLSHCAVFPVDRHGTKVLNKT